MKQICIGIHAHAEPEHLQTILDTLRAHTHGAFELLLLPDGPDDATAAFLESLRHLPQSGSAEPLGGAACFNRLVAHCAADVLILLV